MTKNYISIVTDSSDNHMSCKKTEVVTESVSETQEVYKTKETNQTVTVHKKQYGKCNEVYTEVKNTSSAKIDYSRISSAFVEIENKGKLPWYSENKYKVHFCRNCWLGEGQWQTSTLADLGLYQTYCDHQNNCYIEISSMGSQTTVKYYPIVMIEDLEEKKTYFFELLPLANWYMEICQEYNEKNEERLMVFMSGGYEKNDGWNITLNQNETYKTIPAVYGEVDGGFEEAVAELIKYKREKTVVKYDTVYPPVCFNDYMNCCWAMPTTEKAKTLIDAASDAGVEIFCMDAGWNVSNTDGVKCIGDWAIGKKMFEPSSLREIADYAISKGLKFGVWLEIEGVEDKAEGYTKYNDCLLRRRGKVIGNNRVFYDFRKKEVCDMIEGVFDKLYDIGVRFIKNDYNQTIGIGCDGEKNQCEELFENQRAFLDFIDKIQAKYEDMIIENCGSGSLREDAETLSHFHLQSTSDQEVYTCNPSIISGTMAYMQAEKMGIWSYPYPIRYVDRFDYNVPEEQMAACADGKQTVFNMVTSMLGTMYLSGRIDVADELNKKLIKESICVYKEIRKDIPNSLPIFPCGPFRLHEKGIFCVGNKAGNTAYIAVWKIHTLENVKTFELSKYGEIKNAECIYPVDFGCDVNHSNGNMTVSMPDGDCAMLVKVEFKES